MGSWDRDDSLILAGEVYVGIGKVFYVVHEGDELVFYDHHGGRNSSPAEQFMKTLVRIPDPEKSAKFILDKICNLGDEV